MFTLFDVAFHLVLTGRTFRSRSLWECGSTRAGCVLLIFLLAGEEVEQDIYRPFFALGLDIFIFLGYD